MIYFSPMLYILKIIRCYHYDFLTKNSYNKPNVTNLMHQKIIIHWHDSAFKILYTNYSCLFFANKSCFTIRQKFSILATVVKFCCAQQYMMVKQFHFVFALILQPLFPNTRIYIINKGHNFKVFSATGNVIHSAIQFDNCFDISRL